MLSQRSALILVFGVGVLVLIPVRDARVRVWLLTALNLLFLRLILSDMQLAVALALVVLIYVLLKAVSLQGWRIAAAVALGLVTLALFIFHKMPESSGAPGSELQILLAAVGFSYVTLRTLDLLRAVFERNHPAPAPTSIINYLFPFHMLLAGPIQRYDDFVSQPAVPTAITTPQALAATERIATGVFKKFALALVVKSVFLTGFRSQGWHLLLEAQAFYIWLFLDFSGLSDIAVGIGVLLGIRTPENFDRPYLARNMIVFWERWHISLSQFIRYNLFLPMQLQLSRRTLGRHSLWCASIAFTISFALCGLWHGLSGRYLLWGLLNAAGLIATNLYRHYLTRRLGAKGVRKYLANQPVRVLATILTFEFVAFSLTLIRETA